MICCSVLTISGGWAGERVLGGLTRFGCSIKLGSIGIGIGIGGVESVEGGREPVAIVGAFGRSFLLGMTDSFGGARFVEGGIGEAAETGSRATAGGTRELENPARK